MDEAEQLKIQNARQAELIITYARNAENSVKEIEHRRDIILELEGMLVEARQSALEEAAKVVEEIGVGFSLQSENRSLVIAMASVFLEVADKIRNLQGGSDG